MIKTTRGEKVFDVFNIILLTLFMFLCILPLLNVLAISFSSSAAAAANKVKLWPVQFTIASYSYVFTKQQYFTAFGVTILRTVLGLASGMLVSIITAYPLSKETRDFPQRNIIVWFFFITMLFSGGLIPFYATVTALHLVNTIWALIIPCALNIWNVILLLNFMRGLPKEVTESAYIDGAGDWAILWRIIVPMSTPVLATIALFTAVGHWNSWFDGLIFMNEPKKYPLQTYLQGLVIQIDTEKMKNMTKEELQLFTKVSDRTFKAAQIFIAMVPILCVYPFLQKYFVKGITMGSVKE